MADKILIKRGLKVNLPILDEGEPAFCTDTQEIAIGTATNENIFIPISELHTHPNREILNKLTQSGNESVFNLSNFATKDEVANALDGKASTIHKHDISDINDIDSSNKTNGYVLQYDSTAQKFVSKPLPSGSGSGATSLDGLSDVDVLTTLPVDGNALLYQGGIWKPGSIPNTTQTSSNVYVVELARWGITEGLPSKRLETINSVSVNCYADSAYVSANNNVIGINNAISWAYDNGFDCVVFPRGKYAICYPTPVLMKSGITVNLNGSTFKTIYDSDKKSPFDTRQTTDYYNFYGHAFSFRNCFHAHLKNGIIIGDKYDRSFINVNEVAAEHTVGVKIEQSSSYCTVQHCEISGYMGDNINFMSTGALRTGSSGSGSQQLADINYITGEIIASTNSVISALITIPTGYQVFGTNGQGYARTLGFNVKHFDVFYYKADGTYIGVLKKRKIHTNINIPPTAAKMRLKYYEETDPLKNFEIFIDWGGIPHHNTAEYCEIYNGHRGGVSMGGNYTTVQHCVLRENGKFNTIFMDGVPAFNDPTRYAINQEDNYSDNCTIRNNFISGGYQGILVGAHSTFIEDNHIYNIEQDAICIYGMSFARIHGNYIYNCNRSIGLSGTDYKPAQVHITNNYLSGDIKLDVANYDVVMHENTIVPRAELRFGNADMSNNHFAMAENAGIRNGNIKNCKFFSIASVTPAIRFYDTTVENCKFKDITVSLSPETYVAPSQITNSTFENCKIYNQTKSENRLDKCEFINSWFEMQCVSVQTVETVDYSKFAITNSKFASTSLTRFINSMTNMKNSVRFTVENSTFEIANSDFLQFVTFTYSTAQTTNIEFIRCSIVYSGATPLSTKYFQNEVQVYKGVVADISLKNITLLALTDPKYTLFDANTENVTEPTSGYFKKGKLIQSVSPTAGGYFGWICLTTGYADNTAWGASTTYYKNDRIKVGSNVYVARNSGKSAKTTPSFPAPIEAIVEDKVGIVNWTANATKVLGDLIVPTIANGRYYECTTAGTTGATEPTTFPLTENSTVTDGTVVWTARKIIVWENVGGIATFKPYGLISE